MCLGESSVSHVVDWIEDEREGKRNGEVRWQSEELIVGIPRKLQSYVHTIKECVSAFVACDDATFLLHSSSTRFD